MTKYVKNLHTKLKKIVFWSPQICFKKFDLSIEYSRIIFHELLKLQYSYFEEKKSIEFDFVQVFTQYKVQSYLYQPFNTVDVLPCNLQ